MSAQSHYQPASQTLFRRAKGFNHPGPANPAMTISWHARSVAIAAAWRPHPPSSLRSHQIMHRSLIFLTANVSSNRSPPRRYGEIASRSAA